MEKVFELTRLAQLMSAVMDETDDQVYSFSSGPALEPRFIVDERFFYEHFKGFRVEYDESSEFYKFKLFKVIGGVTFQAVANNLSGLKHLKKHPIKRHKKSLRAVACE